MWISLFGFVVFCALIISFFLFVFFCLLVLTLCLKYRLLHEHVDREMNWIIVLFSKPTTNSVSVALYKGKEIWAKRWCSIGRKSTVWLYFDWPIRIDVLTLRHRDKQWEVTKKRNKKLSKTKENTVHCTIKANMHDRMKKRKRKKRKNRHNK